MSFKHGGKKLNYKVISSSIAIILISIVIIFNKVNIYEDTKLVNNDNIQSNEEIDNNTIVDDIEKTDENDDEIKEGIEIPKIKIKKEEEYVQVSRVPTLIYDGKVYFYNSNKISVEDGKALMDKKLGVTENLFIYLQYNGVPGEYIDLENSEVILGPNDGQGVYTVKGYDEDFRLITYEEVDGVEYLEIWECLNDMFVSTGEDVFGLMNIKGNIDSITWDTFNNWNNETYDPKELNINDTVDDFINAMYNSKPYSLEDKEFRDQFFYNEVEYFAEGEEKQKFLYLKLNDGSEIELRLFSNGYIQSSLQGFVFKVDDTSFNNMWNYIK